MRLKRNNFVKTHQEMLTDQWYVDKYLPHLEQVLHDNHDFLAQIKDGQEEELI